VIDLIVKSISYLWLDTFVRTLRNPALHNRKNARSGAAPLPRGAHGWFDQLTKIFNVLNLEEMMSAINDKKINLRRRSRRRDADAKPAGNDETRGRQVAAPPPRTVVARRARRFFERREETQCSTPRTFFPTA
jgi:hypothetical protein